MSADQTLNEIWSTWNFRTLSHDEQIEFLQQYLPSKITEATLNQTWVEEIAVAEDISEVVNEVLQDAKLPQDFPIPEGRTFDEYASDFKEYCQNNIVVRACSMEQLELPTPGNYPPEALFIRVITHNSKIIATLENWDQAVGFSSYLQRMGSPILPSIQEKRLLYFMANMFDLMASHAQGNQIVAAKDDPDMFSFPSA